MHPQNFFPAFNVRQIDRDLPIEATGPQQSGIKHIGAVRCRDNDDTFLSIEPIHLHQERVQSLFPLVVSTAYAMTTMPADGVDLVDENDAGRRFFSLLEHVPHPGGSDPDKHFHKIGAADGEKGNVGFAGDGPGQQRFTRAGRANQQDPFRNPASELLKLFRIAQKFHQLLDFLFGFLYAGDIAERDFVFVPGEHPGLRFPEVERAFAGHPDLLPEQEIENEQKQGDRGETDDGLGDDVRFGLDRGLNPLRRQFLLQIAGEIQINGGPKLHRLSGLGACALFDIIADQGLGRASFFHHQGERIIFVVQNLLVGEQFEKSVVGDFLQGLIAAAPEQNGQTNQGKGDRDQDHAAPVETGLVSARFILLLRVAIWLRHKISEELW